MKNVLRLLLVGALALVSLVSCTKEEEEKPAVPDSGYDDAYYAERATISSDSPYFSATDDGVEIYFKNEGGTVTVNVSCGCDWFAENSAEDLFHSTTTSTTLTVTAERNTIEDGLSGTITLKTANQRIAFATINIIQTSKAYIILSMEAIDFGFEGGEESVTVKSNYDWDYSYNTSNDWFAIVRNGDRLTVSVEDNDGDDRSETVTITAGDEADNTAEVHLTVTQSGIAAMILTYTIPSASTPIQLPLSGMVDCVVNWGDGNSEEITSTHPSHTYASAGEYDVIINGTVTALSSNGISTETSPLQITAVNQWGKTGLTDMSYAFCYCTKLASLPEYTGDAFSDVTSFTYTFRYCYSLEEIPAGLFDNCTKVTTYYGVFYECSALKEIPEGLFGHCAEVTDLSFAFFRCQSLKTIPEDLFCKLTKATTFNYVFQECYSLSEIPEGLFHYCTEATSFYSSFRQCSSLNTIPAGLFDKCTKVTTFDASFYDCTALAEVPAKLFDNCPEVTDFGAVFYGCGILSAIPDGLFDKCPKVKDFDSAFDNCAAIQKIPVALFDNCPEVTDFSYVFYGCSSIKTIPEGLFDKCPKVTNFSASFYGCTALGEIPEGLFDNCQLATNFSYCFRGCSSLVTVPHGLFDNCPEVTTFHAALHQCTNLTAVPADLFSKNLKVTNFQSTFWGDIALTGESPYDVIDGNKVHLYERADHPDIYAVPTSTSNCFTDCTKLSDYSGIPSAWGGGGK